MSFCKMCGTQIENGSCPNCGYIPPSPQQPSCNSDQNTNTDSSTYSTETVVSPLFDGLKSVFSSGNIFLIMATCGFALCAVASFILLFCFFFDSLFYKLYNICSVLQIIGLIAIVVGLLVPLMECKFADQLLTISMIFLILCLLELLISSTIYEYSSTYIPSCTYLVVLLARAAFQEKDATFKKITIILESILLFSILLAPSSHLYWALSLGNLGAYAWLTLSYYRSAPVYKHN